LAREESAKEDLLRQATGLSPRAAWRIGESEIVIGFRTAAAISIFFGEDPVFQFNDAGQLRRGFLNGILLKADRGFLVKMSRHRTDHSVELRSHQCSLEEQEAIVQLASGRISQIATQLREGSQILIGEEPPQSDVEQRFLDWVDQFLDTLSIANRPNVHSGS